MGAGCGPFDDEAFGFVCDGWLLYSAVFLPDPLYAGRLLVLVVYRACAGAGLVAVCVGLHLGGVPGVSSNPGLRVGTGRSIRATNGYSERHWDGHCLSSPGL
jgi:hypothetical protein